MKVIKDILSIKRIMIVLFILIFIFLSIYRYNSINNSYPTPIHQQYKMKEHVNYSNCEISVNDYYFMEQSDINLLFESEQKNYQKVECIVLNVNIQNNSDSFQQVDITSLILKSDIWKNAIHFAGFMELNEDASMIVELDSKQTKTLLLPFSINSVQFSSLKTWSHCKTMQYELVLSLYPIKNTIKL